MKQARDYAKHDLADEFNLLAQIVQPGGSGRADVLNKRRRSGLMLLQCLKVLGRKTAQEVLKVRAQPFDIGVYAGGHPANRKVIEQGESGAVTDKLANVGLKTNQFDSRQLALKVAPRHRSGGGVQLADKGERGGSIRAPG